MLTWVQQGELWLFEHVAVRPCIYLDFWAFDEIGKDGELTAGLAAALRASGGTLCFSTVNGQEPRKPEDPKHARRVDAVLRAAMPHVAFVDLGATALSVGIVETVPGSPPDSSLGAPPLERDELAIQYSEVMSKLDGPGWAEGMWCARDGRDLITEVAERIVAKWEEKRQEDEWRAQALSAPINRNANRAWRVTGDIMLPAVQNIAHKIKTNDGADLLHSLSLCYCDFVLLDQAFARRAEATRLKLAEHGERIGRAISQPMGGGRRLINELVSFGTVGHAHRSSFNLLVKPSDS